MQNIFLKLILLFLVIGSANFAAEANVCNLRLKIMSYQAESPKNGIAQAAVVVKSLKTKEKIALNFSPNARGIENLAGGKYEIEVNSRGYKKRKKEINLDCEYADDDKNFPHFLYLWKEKSNSETDLVEYQSDVQEAAQKQGAQDVKQTEISADKRVKVFGKVKVEILIDEDGNVVSARVTDGKPLLNETSVKAARKAKFAPTFIDGIPVKVAGILSYNFVP